MDGQRDTWLIERTAIDFWNVNSSHLPSRRTARVSTVFGILSTGLVFEEEDRTCWEEARGAEQVQLFQERCVWRRCRYNHERLEIGRLRFWVSDAHSGQILLARQPSS